MDLATFCLNQRPDMREERLTMADIGEPSAKKQTIRQKEIEKIWKLAPELGGIRGIGYDLFFIRIDLADPEFVVRSPADWSYIFGGARRGVWVLVDNTSVYVISLDKNSEMRCRDIASGICDKVRRVYAGVKNCGTQYAVTGCWAM